MHSVILYCPELGRDLEGIYKVAPDAEVHVGERTVPGQPGCLDAHKAIVRGTLERDIDRIWVIEDDCGFLPLFNLARWERDAEWAQREGYDVMTGGSTRTYDNRVVREGMVEVSAFHSSHCLVYFRSGFEKMLNAVQPLDWSLGRDCGMRCVLTWPFVAVQRPMFSGIEGCYVNYVPLYNAHEQHLEAALRMSR